MSETAHRHHGIDYIEFPVTAKAFYGAAFGWQFTDYGPSYCEFTDGERKGGFELAESVSPGRPLLVLYSQDLEESQRRIEAAGGRIVKAIFDFPGGRRFHFTDPDGYELAVWSEG